MSSAVVPQSPSPPSSSPHLQAAHQPAPTCLRSPQSQPHPHQSGAAPSDARSAWNSLVVDHDRGHSQRRESGLGRIATDDDRGEGSSRPFASRSSSAREDVIHVEATPSSTSTPLSRFMADYHSSSSSSSAPVAGPSRRPSPSPSTRPILSSTNSATAPYLLITRPHPIPHRVRRHITCSTCRLTLREPVTLPCGHAICLSCLPSSSSSSAPSTTIAIADSADPDPSGPDPDPGPGQGTSRSHSGTGTGSNANTQRGTRMSSTSTPAPTGRTGHHSSRGNRPPYLCTRPKCAHKLRSMAGYGGVFMPGTSSATTATSGQTGTGKGSELKVDVVLQKLIVILKAGVPELFNGNGVIGTSGFQAQALPGSGPGVGLRGLEGMSNAEREAALMREDEGVDWTTPGVPTTFDSSSSPSTSTTSTSSSPAYDSFAPRRPHHHQHRHHHDRPSTSSRTYYGLDGVRSNQSSSGITVAGSTALSLPLTAAEGLDDDEEEEEDADDRSPSSTESTPWRAMADEDEGAGGEGKRGHKTPAWRSTKRVRRTSSENEQESDIDDHVDDREAKEEAAAAAAVDGDDQAWDEAVEAKLQGHSHTHTSKAARLRAPSTTSSDLNNILVPAALGSDLLSELECQVCIGLFHQPVTTPCGHTFCRPCLARALDHSDKCPLCRADYPGFRFFQDQPSNASIASIILSLFPTQYATRLEAIKREEARSDALDTPIFVCSLAFPNMPTFLHVFEPRYRLMIRRAMEKDGRFGMCLPSRNPGQGGVYEYGTMLQIRSVQILQDGRSMVETMGLWRFRVLEKGGLDGYAVGRVERIEDIAPELEEELERAALARNDQRTPSVTTGSSATPSTSTSTGAVPMDAEGRPSDPATISLSATDDAASHAQALAAGAPTSSIPNPNALPSPPPPATSTSAAASSTAAVAAAAAAGIQLTPGPELTTTELMQVCREFIGTLRSGSAPWLVQRLNSTFGPMPEEPSDFSFWMAAVIPIDEYEKARLLRITSPRLRLILLAHWASGLQGSWWFRSGCIAS